MDRNLHKSEKKLANRGWDDMRRMLDQEMPGEYRRRRPVALIWILSLLIPAGGALGWWLFGPAGPGNTAEPITVPVATAPAPPVRASGTDMAPNKQTKTGNTLPETTTAPAPETQHSGPSIAKNIPAPDTKYRKPLQEHSVGITRQKPEKNTIATNSPATPEHRESISTTPPESSQEIATIHTAGNSPVQPPTPEQTTDATTAAMPATNDAQPTTQPAPEQAPTESSVAETTPATNLPGDTPRPPAATEPTPATTNPPAMAANSTTSPEASPLLPLIDPFVKKEQQPHWGWGAGGGVLSESATGYSGAVAGLTAEWKPLRQWGLRSGLAYQYQTLTDQDRPVLSISAETYAAATGDQDVLKNSTNFAGPVTAATEAVIVPVTRLHRVEVPVLAFWQPFSKLRVLGGVSVGRILHAESGDRSLNNNVVFEVGSGAYQEGLNAEITAQLDNWDTRWNAGVSYRPLKSLEIGLFYQRSFSGSRNLSYDQLATELLDTPGSFNVPSTELPSGLSSRGALFSLTAAWFF